MTVSHTLRWAAVPLITLWPMLVAAQPAAEGEPPALAEEPEPEVDEGDASAPPPERSEGRTPQAGAPDRAAAESLRRVGIGLMELGQYADACPKLEQSMKGAPDAETAWALARCRDEEGKLASAWAAYRQASALLRGDPRAAEASERAADLEPRVPKLTVAPTVSLPGMQVWRDGTRFGVGLFGVPIATDPGVHTIEVRADGYLPWTATVELKASERLTVQVPALTRIDVSPAGKTRRPARTAELRGGRDALWYAGLIAIGVGVGTTAAGGIVGLVAARDVRAAEADDALCGADKACTPTGLDAIAAADRKATASTVLVASGAGVALAGVAVLLWPRGSGDTEAAGTLVPAVGPTGGGVSWKWRF